MKFELEKTVRGATDDELLEDMRRCARALGRDTITGREYEESGKANPCTIRRRFGSWPKALEKAGLKPSRSKIGITDEELFESIKSLWMNLGRQPRYAEVRSSGLRFSARTYEKRFGSWLKALREFVAWANSDSPENNPHGKGEANQEGPVSTERVGPTKRQTCREISERQRFRILLRDGFRCRACGASPLTKPGTELHVDHILPWSKGGETTDDNLETKCVRCNLGKGNAFEA